MAQLIVITQPELAAGFRLAGVQTIAARTAEEAHHRLLALLDDEDAGIVAIDRVWLEALEPALQHRIAQGYRPVVIGIPQGQAGDGATAQRERLAELIRRAIGVRISFGGGRA